MSYIVITPPVVAPFAIGGVRGIMRLGEGNAHLYFCSYGQR